MRIKASPRTSLGRREPDAPTLGRDSTLRRFATLVGLGLAMSGCSTPNEAGVDGPVMYHVNAPSGDGEDAEISGLIEISGECLYVSSQETGIRYPVVWPQGTSWDAEDQTVVLASGELVAAGDAVSGGGGYRDANDIPGSEAGALAARCLDEPLAQVAVVNNFASAIGPAG